jgi:HD-like signal output (HDOD) protein
VIACTAHPASHDTSHRQLVALDGPALDRLASLVRAHFDEHQPAPASFPAVASQVVDLVEHPNVDVARLAHLIEREPALCMAVLAVANSAANRRTSTVQNIRTAINLLGLKRVANIAVGVACRSLFDVEERVEYELFPHWWNRLFHAAMTDAFAASFVALQHQRSSSDGIFLAGMLHDLGKSLGLRALASLLISGAVSGVPDDNSVETLLSRNRAAIGAIALAKFNMSESLVALCARQDDENLPEAAEWSDAHIVRLVSAFNELRTTTVNTEQPIRRLLAAARTMHLDAADLLAVAQQVSEQASHVSLLFSTTDETDETGYIDFVTRCLT